MARGPWGVGRGARAVGRGAWGVARPSGRAGWAHRDVGPSEPAVMTGKELHAPRLEQREEARQRQRLRITCSQGRAGHRVLGAGKSRGASRGRGAADRVMGCAQGTRGTCHRGVVARHLRTHTGTWFGPSTPPPYGVWARDRRRGLMGVEGHRAVAHTWYKRASTSGGGKRSMLGSSVGHSATTWLVRASVLYLSPPRS